MCSACSSKAAVCFCMCTGTETLLCESCFFLHFQKNITGQHPTFPVTILPQIKQPGFMDKLQTRTASLPQVRECAVRNIGEVDKCMAELTCKIEELNKFYSDMMERLREKKREIEESMKEVETTILQEMPELKTPFGKPLRDYLERKSTSLELFQYRLSAFDPKSLLEIMNPSLISDYSKFPYVFGNSLRVYDLKLKTSTAFTLAGTFTTGAAFCFLGNNDVLCLGGSPSSNVYMLDISTQKLSAMPNLNAHRQYPGIIKVDLCVYVFGSYSPNLASCERLSLTNRVWTNLKDMNSPRFAFQPAVFLSDIFLANPQGGSRTIEVFNTERETFRTLSFQVPAQISSNICAFVVAEELYLAGNSCACKWKINSTIEPQVIAFPNWLNCYSNSPAFVIGSEVYLVPFSTGNLFKFNFQTNSLVP